MDRRRAYHLQRLKRQRRNVLIEVFGCVVRLRGSIAVMCGSTGRRTGA
jgi:hypothetical protein